MSVCVCERERGGGEERKGREGGREGERKRGAFREAAMCTCKHGGGGDGSDDGGGGGGGVRCPRCIQLGSKAYASSASRHAELARARTHTHTVQSYTRKHKHTQVLYGSEAILVDELVNREGWTSSSPTAQRQRSKQISQVGV